jgi:hypothetical protein
MGRTGKPEEQRQTLTERLYEMRTDTDLDSPNRQAMIDVLIDHHEAETGIYGPENATTADHGEEEMGVFDLEKTMGTLVNEPIYGFFGSNQFARQVTGQQAVRAMYTQYGEVLPRQQMFADRVTVGNDAIVFEGYIEMRPGLASAIAPEVTPDTSRPWVLRKHLCVIFPFEGGKMTGEISYFDGPLTAQDIAYIEG